MRAKLAAVAIVVGATLCGLSAMAAVPQTISYQGYLTDAQGAPVNGTVSMTFGLYTAPAGTAAPLWTETQDSVTVTNGVYSATLGSATPLALPFDQQYWLGITVGSDPEMTPRQALVSVPYAQRARTIDDGSVTASKIGENCQVGELLVRSAAGWQCGTVTSVQNGAGTCIGQTCNYFCGPGFANCNGNWSDGCELNLMTNVSNCGACGNVCQTQAHQTASCSNGSCAISCVSGWSNCDNDNANGCEVSVNTDVNNCGSCGRACPNSGPHVVSSSCAGGTCGFVCDFGYEDSDHAAANGCEDCDSAFHCDPYGCCYWFMLEGNACVYYDNSAYCG